MRDSRERLGAWEVILSAAVIVALGVFISGAVSNARRDVAADHDSGSAAAFPPRPNILLLTVDTLRADHLSAYGYPRETSPTLDRLASEGVRFERPTAQWPKTGPSFASMMTGTYPSDNGIVRHVGIPLSCGFRMLAEELHDAGYGTHAVVANGALAREFHFDQGFDTYVETWKTEAEPGEPDPSEARGVNRLVEGALERIDRSRPYFLWVHYLDPHFPYRAPEPWRDQFVGDSHYDPSVRLEIAEQPRREMIELGHQQVLDGHDELDYYVARYDGEIAYVDAQIGALLERLESEGFLETTLVVMTSDHGESLGEHYYLFDHGRFGFDTCQRVPLLFHFPDVLAPRVDAAPVELLDVAPTILEAAGVRLRGGTAWMRGRSLVPRLLGRETAPELAHGEAGYGENEGWQRTVTDGRFKMIYAQKPQVQQWIGGRGVFFTLYDLDVDPGETVDVSEAHPETFETLQAALWDLKESPPMRAEREAPECPREGPMDDETRRQLEALGYL